MSLAEKRIQQKKASLSAVWSPDARLRQSEKMRRRWADPEWRNARGKSASKPALCPDCGETDLAKFYTDEKGLRTNARCRECHKAYCKARWHSKSSIEKQAAKAISYGLTIPEFMALYEKQNGKCAICSEAPSTKRGLHVDHCHTTGEVRGLLCHGCNVGIGALKDDAGLLRAAIAYLEGND